MAPFSTKYAVEPALYNNCNQRHPQFYGPIVAADYLDHHNSFAWHSFHLHTEERRPESNLSAVERATLLYQVLILPTHAGMEGRVNPVGSWDSEPATFLSCETELWSSHTKRKRCFSHFSPKWVQNP